MKKLISLVFVMLLSSLPLFSDTLHIGISGGYSYSNMQDLNDSWEKAKAAALGNSQTASYTEFGNSVWGNLDINTVFADPFAAGARSGAQYVFPVVFTETLDFYYGGTTYTAEVVDRTFYAVLVPAMAGFSAKIKIPDTESGLVISAYGGWGFAYAAEQYESSLVPGYSFGVIYEGGAPMADLSVSAEIPVFPFILLSINAGYRYAEVTGLKSVESFDIPGYGTIETGAGLTDIDDKEIALNFTGFNIGAGINIRF